MAFYPCNNNYWNSIQFINIKSGYDQGWGDPTQSITNAIIGHYYWIYSARGNQAKPIISGIEEIAYFGAGYTAGSSSGINIFIGKAISTTITVHTMYAYSFQEIIFK